MRKTKLLTATALSLILGSAAFAMAGQAAAATTISTATTAPVKTSTTGDLTVDAAGSITLTSGTAITVDSDNKLTLNGKVDMSKSADGSTGVLITDVPGRTASGLTVAGAITVTDDFTPTDTTSPVDGIPEAPFSDGKTRYGIHSVGTAAFNGDVSITSGSVITVDGDNSYGVRFENNVNGKFTFDGKAVITGNNSAGVALDNGATGNVYLSGAITTLGKGDSAVRLNGDYDGNVIIDGSYSARGYATVDALSAAGLATVLATPADLEQSGPLIDIQASSIAHGIRIGAAQANNVDTDTSSTDSNPDEDGNGIPDAEQTAAVLAIYGSAPVLQIASADHDIVIHANTFTSTAVSPPAVPYGLMIGGTLNGNGVYSGINQTAVKLGGAGHNVMVENGINVSGVILSAANGGTATGLSMQSGAKTPLLDVTGSVRANGTSVTTANTTVTPNTYATVDASAIAVDIASGAELPAINIAASGNIIAVGAGSTTSSTAIRDQSNTLVTVTNKNILSATITPSDNNGDGVAETVTHTGIAIDTRTNTAGLTLTQTDTALTDDTIAAPYIAGDILLGSGNDVITSSGGKITGNVDFGAGSNSLTLSNGATYLGKMTGAGTVAVDIAKGTLNLASGSQLNVTTLHVGAESVISAALNTASPTSAPLNGTGNAVFDNGAKINLLLDGVMLTPQTFAVVKAANIDIGTMTTAALKGDVPYIYNADLTLNAAKTQLDAAFRLKTQSEAGFSSNEYAAFAPILTAVSADPLAQLALVSKLDKASFDRIYEQYLPDYSGENLLGLALGAQSLNRSLSSLTLIPGNDGGQYWLQEYGYRTSRKHGESAGFKSTGFSFAGGRESKLNEHNMVGVYLSYTSGSPLDNFAIAKEDNTNSDMTIGGYWRVRNGAFKGWVHGGAGLASMETTRQLLTSVTVNAQTVPINHVAHAKWNGVTYSAGAGASVDYKLGWLGVTPQVFADLYGLNEKDHQESIVGTDTTGADAFALSIGERNGHIASSTALLNLSYTRMFVKPELWFGYRQVLSGSIPNTVTSFKGGTPFTLVGSDLAGGGPIAGFRLSADNEWSYFSIEGDYEKHDAYTNYSVALRTRFQF